MGIELLWPFEQDPCQPPDEFCILRRGWNDGLLFDDEASASVMAPPIQKEALPAYFPTDGGNARGWFRVYPRGGELWAIYVVWSSAAEGHILDRFWHYVSTIVDKDPVTDRVQRIHSVAVTPDHWPHNAPPLAAACRGRKPPSVESLLSAAEDKFQGPDGNNSLTFRLLEEANAASGAWPWNTGVLLY